MEASGLLIEAIREVKPPDQLAARDPAARRWQRIPLFDAGSASQRRR
jgi:hypothetical protein